MQWRLIFHVQLFLECFVCFFLSSWRQIYWLQETKQWNKVLDFCNSETSLNMPDFSWRNIQVKTALGIFCLLEDCNNISRYLFNIKNNFTWKMIYADWEGKVFTVVCKTLFSEGLSISSQKNSI